MADTEKKVVLTVGTGNSQQTVKGLKEEIKQLRDALLNLDKGSDEYTEAVSKLQDDQRKLNEVMALTKKEATALDGSYDALVHKMSQLKKEWRATADEAERADLGGQIDEINTKLKEMDASTGNFQRNVGNYVSHWEGMPDAVDGVAKSVGKVNDEMVASSAAPKSFGEAMREMNESIEPTKQKFEAISNISSGLASGFAAVQGAAALFGIENEDLQKSLVKVQAAMAIAQGIGGLKGLVEGVGKAKVAFAGLGAEVQLLSKTMGKTGWIAVIMAVVTAVTLLVGWLKRKNDEIDEGTAAMKKFNEVAAEARIETADEILKIKLLAEVTTDITFAMETRRRAAIGLLEMMGMEVTEANVLKAANGELEKSINGVTEAMIRRKVAEAQMEHVMDLYKEYLTLAQDLRDFSLDEIGDYSFGTHVEATWKNFWWNFGLSDESGYDVYTRDYKKETAKAKTAYEEALLYMKQNTDADTLVSLLLGNSTKTTGTNEDDEKKALEERINGYTEALKSARQQLNEWYQKEIALAQKYGLDTQAITAKYNADLKKINDLEKASTGSEVDAEKKKAQEMVKTYEDFFKSKEELLKEKYEEDLALAEKHGLDTTYITKKYLEDLEELQKKTPTAFSTNAAEDIKDLERIASNEIAKISNIAKEKDIAAETDEERIKIEEERAAQEYAIRAKLEQDKLDLLKKYLKQAEEEQNQDEIVTLQEQIADQEIAIETAKYDEFKRLRDNDRADREKDKAERIQMVKSIADITVAGLSATKEILDKVAESYQIDGEISEEEAKKLKAIKYSTTVIDMMQGIVSAMASAAGGGPAAWIAGGIQAATIAATGAMSLKEISKQDFKTTNNTPTVLASAYQSDIPFSYTRQITGAQEYESLNKDTKVYVLESDISNAMNKVKVRENESSF